MGWNAETVSVLKEGALAVGIVGAIGLVLGLLERRRLNQVRETQDQVVLAQLASAGSDLSKPHPLDFHLHLKSEADARRIGEPFISEGFKVEVSTDPAGVIWTCGLKKVMVPDLAQLTDLRRRFTGAAERCGGTYDGWGAAVVR